MSSFRCIFNTLIITFLAISLSACGFRLRDNFNLPSEIQSLSVTSFDPYGHLTREMKKRLQRSHIEITAPAKHIANLHLISESYGESTLSLYQNATVAQRQFNYSASYSVLVPNKGNYNFSTSLTRSYLDNPLTALAKSVEEEMLAQEMRVETTKQIMRQLARLTAHIEEFDKIQAQEAILNQSIQTEKDEGVDVKIRFEGKNESTKLPDFLMSN